MPPRVSRRAADRVVRLGQAPDGSGGLAIGGVNMLTHDGMLSDYEVPRGERIRTFDGSLTPAPGPKRAAAFTQQYGSRVFGATGKYARVAAFCPIGYGGFGYRFSITALRNAGGVGYVVSTNTDVGAQPVLVRVQTSGTLTVATTWDDATQSVITTSALTDDSVQHGLVVYDPDAGTYTLYLNGGVTGTPVTGLSATMRPIQTTNSWYFGASFAAAAVVAPFVGKVDAFTLFSFAGVHLSGGLLDALLAHTFRQWPNAMLPMVVAQYDFDEPSGSVLYDRSRHANHGVYTGASTPSDPVGYTFPVGNHVGLFQGADGSRTNLAALGGALHYQQIRAAI